MTLADLTRVFRQKAVSIRIASILGVSLAMLTSLSQTWALPGWLPAEGRVWLIALDGEVGRETLQTESFLKGNALAIRFSATAEDRDRFYALRAGASGEEPPKVWINDGPLDVRPVFGDDGAWYFRVPGSLLEAGENTLELSYPVTALKSAPEAEVFSLTDPYEEDHFRRTFTPSAIRVQPPADPAQNLYDVLHYDLEIPLNMNATVLDATLTMTAKSLSDTLQIVPLDFNDNGGTLNASWVDQGPSTSTLTFTQNSTAKRLFITLPGAVPEGNAFTVRVRYGGVPAPSKIFSPAYVRETHGSPAVPVIYTFSEPYGARDWWPCKDIPEDKATMDLHITCPQAYTPVSNGLLDSVVTHANGTHTYHWRETHPMATYLASICCTNYQVVRGTYTALDGQTTMEMAHYLYPENFASESPALAATIDVMEYFAETFGEYPFLNEKYVTATHNDSSGMEHQTCTSLPGRDLVAGAQPGYGRRNIHELAHMWFGDLITMRHFDHLWLNEGFATYCEALFYEHQSGAATYHSYVNAWSVSDTLPLVNPNADAFTGALVYRKGAWVLHMLRHVVGDEDFFAAVRNYVANPALRYGTALSIDLQNEFEAQSGMDLDYFFDQWLYRAGRPAYRWSWSTRTQGASTILQVRIQQTQSSGAFTMPVDIEVRDIQGNVWTEVVFTDQKTQTLEVDLGASVPIQVRFDPNNWILKSSVTQESLMPQVVVLSVIAEGDQASIRWQAVSDADLAGYELFQTEDLQTWTPVAGATQLPAGSTAWSATGISSRNASYFVVRALGNTKSPGTLSDVYGCLPAPGSNRALIVEGYDRWDTQAGRGGSFQGAYYHGQALDAGGMPFDTCDNDVVGASVNLGDYAIVLYVLGEESTGDETFSASEQSLVIAYLNAGGNLFVSGAEIGWDLDNRGDTNDRNFYRNYLKAVYAGDDSGTTQCQGTSGSIFGGLGAFQFGVGSGFSYFIDYPDRMTPSAGAAACLTYAGGTADTAGVQYDGAFKVINLGFPFDTIVEEQTRRAIMQAALNFFGVNRVPQWQLY